MPSKSNTPQAALFVALNLFFIVLASGYTTCPTPSPSPIRYNATSCPRDAIKLGVCANVLGRLLGLDVGNPPNKPCCSLLEGLVDIEAAICLCTAIKANVLGMNLNVPLSLTLLLNICSKEVPKDFQCA